MEPMYLSIQPVETGKRIKQLLSEQNYTIREIQGAFGFENPQAIYCIFRKNRALAPHERSAVPLGTDHCPVR